MIKSYKFYSDKPEYKAVSDDKMADLIKIAKRHVKSKKGSQYEKQAIKSTVSYMARIVKNCQTQIENMKDIDVVFKINKLGIPVQAFWSKNETAECFMKGGMLSRMFPRPPINNFHYHVAIKMKN